MRRHFYFQVRGLAFVLGLMTLLMGLAILIGWQLNIEVAKEILAGQISLEMNAAVGIICFALSLTLLSLPKSSVFKSAALFSSGFGFIIGVVTLAEQYPASRIAPATGVSFIVLGSAHFLTAFGRPPRYRVSQVLFLVTGLISFQSLNAYANGIQSPFGLIVQSHLAVHTAICFIFLSLGFLLNSARHGYMRVLLAQTQSGKTARRLMTALICMPPIFLCLERWGERLGIFDKDFGTLLRMLAGVTFFVTLVWRNTEKLHFVERARKRINRISARQMAEKEILLAEQKLVVAKSEFLANISHEIRTPLNGIIGMSKLLSGTPLNTNQNEFVQTIKTSSDSLLSLVNQVLDLAKIESGKFAIEEVDFELRSLIQSAISIVTFATKIKGLQLVSETDPQLSDFYQGDPLRLQQVLLNLLNNAVKFSMSGVVKLRISLLEDSPTSSDLLFEVIDQGPGFNEETKKKLFKSFSQGDGSISRKHGGTGLGLAISKELVNLMHGHIDVESSEGKGARFFFTIPLKKSKTKQFESPRSLAVSLEPKKLRGHLLIVEDNRINQRVAVEMVKLLGCTSRIVENGSEALRVLSEEEFDLVLMDCQMPLMDGYEATKRIRRGEAGAKNLGIPILTTTANAIQGDIENCLEIGMDDYICKPIVFEEFAIKVENWLASGKRSYDT